MVETAVSEVVADAVPAAESVVCIVPVVPVGVPEPVSDCVVMLASVVLPDVVFMVGLPQEQSRAHMQSNIGNIAFFIEIPSLCKLYGIFILSV